MSKTITVLTLISALGIAAVATAQDKGPHDAAIKGRQAMFQTFNFNLGILGDMAKGKTEYNADIAKQSAENLDAAANFGHIAMWPEGSDSESEGNAKNRSLPAIWSNMSDVDEKFKALQAATATMASQAGGGLDALKGAMGDVGGSCKACHDDYRAKRR